MKALLSGLLLAALALTPFSSRAAETPAVGRDYVEIADGKPYAAGAGIEVAEVFGYTCPHCAHFEPQLREWKATLPKDVRFVAVPAAFGGVWNTWARAYFAADNLGLSARTHQAVFDAIHERGALPRNPSHQELATFYAGHGVSAEAFQAALSDPKVDGQLDAAAAFARRSGIEGTPTVIVAGRYRVLGHDFDDMLRIADWLIARERGAKAR
jgi:thiol:disulfide interchange protein DsbA